MSEGFAQMAGAGVSTRIPWIFNLDVLVASLGGSARRMLGMLADGSRFGQRRGRHAELRDALSTTSRHPCALVSILPTDRLR
jgi:hypothetical protein